MHPIKPFVTLDQLESLDIRVGTIRSLQTSDEEPALLLLLIDFLEFQQSCFLIGKKHVLNTKKSSANKHLSP